jgi:hypothetical protein
MPAQTPSWGFNSEFGPRVSTHSRGKNAATDDAITVVSNIEHDAIPDLIRGIERCRSSATLCQIAPSTILIAALQEASRNGHSGTLREANMKLFGLKG